MVKLNSKFSHLLGLIFFHILFFSSVKGQIFENGNYTHQVSDSANNLFAEPLKIALPPSIPNSVLREGYLYVQLDLPNDYGDIDFSAQILFNLQISDPISSTICQSCALNISQHRPKSLYYLDISQSTAILNADSISIEIDSMTVSSSNQDIENLIQNELRVSLRYQWAYDIDANSIRIDTLNSFVKDKTATFRWTANSPSPNYQFQLLRLYNTDETYKNIDSVRAVVDWSKALSIETQSSKTALKLVLAEGTGFYLWRVRSIGSLYEGGITNPQNYGAWTCEGSAGSRLGFAGQDPNNFPIDRLGTQFSGFFFLDPDDQVNNIYSRTFTEENRVSESVTYFNGLQQTKQSQTRIPSQKNTVTTQTFQDYSGRPALTTLPVPEREEGLAGYKSEFVKNDSVKLYTVQDFDAENTIQNPSKISQGDSSAFKYYQGENYEDLTTYEGISDTMVVKDIPNAEGYAFTRTLYYNDGTDRVREQSGVGKTHMIGDAQGDNGGGKTVKTYFERATEGELIRLFGDEAPDAASVIKTITIDQNQTASITYTSKEGNVIATCLIQADQSNQGLAALQDSAQVAPISIEDRVSDNFQKFTKIASSKRINLNQATTVQIAYQNACTQNDTVNIPPCSFLLNVLIRRLDGQSITGISQETSQNRTSWNLNTDSLGFVLSQDTIVSCYDSLTFNDINLPAGSYIIEKQLSPTNDFFAAANSRQASIGNQTTPLTNLIATWLDSVQCNGGWDSFYNKIETLSEQLTTCANTDTSSRVACYSNLDDLYRDDLGLTDTLPFFVTAHQIEVRRNFEIIINTPECFDVRIPLTNDQVINCDSVNTDFYGKNKDYNDVSGTDKRIGINPFMFLDEGLKATGNEGLIRTEFYPDFEGYAYSFFWDCTPPDDSIAAQLPELIRTAVGANADIEAEKANFKNQYINLPSGSYLDSLLQAYYIDSSRQVYEVLGLEGITGQNQVIENKILYIYYNYLAPYMQGWETPGTFNTMAFHMLNDVYSADGYTHDNPNLRQVIYEGPSVKRDECGNILTLANNSIPPSSPTNKTSLPQYYCQDLLNCWMNQLAYIKNTAGNCPNELWLDIDLDGPPYRVSDKVDDENEGNQGIHDNHFDDNIKIKGFFKKLLFGRKIKKASKKARSLQVPLGDPEREELGAEDEDAYLPINPQYHAINEFLNCTGYKFAKILSPTSPSPLALDSITNFVYSVPANSDGNWIAYEGTDRGYQPEPTWQLPFQDSLNNVLELFEYMYDPIYAFKYFEYPEEVSVADTLENGYRHLEISTCYKQYDPTCYICGYGNVVCQATAPSWSAGQRFAFYQTLKSYTPIIEDAVLFPLPKDYYAAGYIDTLESVGFTLWVEDDTTYLDETEYAALRDGNFALNGERLQSKIEFDIAELNLQVSRVCEEKRAVLKNKFVDLLQANCYEIVTCCAADSIDTRVDNSNASNNAKILEEDIDVLVEQMILQCKERGQIGSFRIYRKGCKYASNFSLGDFIADIEYGVVNSQETTGDAFFHYRDELSLDSSFTADENDTLQYIDIVTGETLNIVDMSASNYGDSTSVLNYCEWNARREVMEMEMNINIPNRCPNQDSTLAAPYDASCNSPAPFQNQASISGGNALPSDWRPNPTVLRMQVKIKSDDEIERTTQSQPE